MHRLALRMGRTVAELSCTLTTDELASWYAFDRLNPIECGRAEFDALFSNLSLTVAQIMGVKRKGGGALKIADFMLFKRAEKPRPALDVMRSWFGGIIKRKDRK